MNSLNAQEARDKDRSQRAHLLSIADLDRDEIEAIGVSDPAFLMFKDLVFEEVDVATNEEAATDPAVPAQD